MPPERLHPIRSTSCLVGLHSARPRIRVRAADISVRLRRLLTSRPGAAEQVWLQYFALTGRASAEQLQAFANGQEPLIRMRYRCWNSSSLNWMQD